MKISNFILRQAQDDTERSRSVKSQISKSNTLRKMFITLALIMLPLFNVNAQSQTSTSSQTLGTPTKSVEDKEIQTLKEKIATRVAELREKNNKAVSGTVAEIITQNKVTKFKIKNWREEELEVKIDPVLTKFYQILGAETKEVKSSDVKKDTFIIVSGVIKEKSVEANSIYLDELFIVGSGKITEVNKQDYYISLVTQVKENYTLDIETFTKQLMVNIKTLKSETMGFSKIKEGDTIHFVIKKTKQPEEPNRYSAQRILIVPQEYFQK